MRRITDSDYHAIVHLSAGGMRARDVAARAAVSVTCVRNTLKRNAERGTPIPNASRALTPEREDVIVALYQAGTSKMDIARQEHIHRRTVLRVLQDRGVVSRPAFRQKGCEWSAKEGYCHICGIWLLESKDREKDSDPVGGICNWCRANYPELVKRKERELAIKEVV